MILCGNVWHRRRVDGGDLTCLEPQGRSHGYMHRNGGIVWLSGHDGVLIDRRRDYRNWWDQAADLLEEATYEDAR